MDKKNQQNTKNVVEENALDNKVHVPVPVPKKSIKQKFSEWANKEHEKKSWTWKERGQKAAGAIKWIAVGAVGALVTVGTIFKGDDADEEYIDVDETEQDGEEEHDNEEVEEEETDE